MGGSKLRSLKKAHQEVIKDSSSSASTSQVPPTQTQPTRYARSSGFQLSNLEIWCGLPRQKGVGTGKEKGKERDKTRGLFTREPLVRTLGSSSSSALATNETQTQTEQMMLLSLLTTLSSSARTEQATNGTLFSTLSAIDSSSNSGTGEGQLNTALVNALKGLLAAAAISSISSHTDTGTGMINPASITNSNSNS
jgi:hypothetical protein